MVSSPSGVTCRASRRKARPEAGTPSILLLASERPTTGRVRFPPGVRRWGIVGTTAEARIKPTSAATSAAAATGAVIITTTAWTLSGAKVSVPVVAGPGIVEDIGKHSDEERPKDDGEPAVVAVRLFEGADKLRMALLALGGEGEAVLDGAGALEDVGVVGGRVALADDVGAAEADVVREGGGAAPFDVLARVRGALVGAAHDVNVGEAAEGRVREAGELGHRGHATVGGARAVAAEGEGLDLGEEDGVAGLLAAPEGVGGGGAA